MKWKKLLFSLIEAMSLGVLLFAIIINNFLLGIMTITIAIYSNLNQK